VKDKRRLCDLVCDRPWELGLEKYVQRMGERLRDGILVRVENHVTVVVEIKGYEDDQTKAKHTAAKRWWRR
jgi:hypothetical protein